MVDSRGKHAESAGRLPSDAFQNDGARRGFHRLHFEPGLESEFRVYYDAVNRGQARVVFLFGAMILLVFSLHNLHAYAPPLNHMAFFVQGVVLAPILALAWLGSYVERLRLAVLSLACLSAVTVGLFSLYAQAYRQGEPFPYEGMLLLLMVGYFAVGLRFPQALAFGVLLVLTFVLSEIAWSPEQGRLPRHVLYLISANVIGAIGAYSHEYSRRHEFLAARQLRSEANRDGLTGLHNRRYLDEQFPRLWAQAQRERRRIAVAFFDVDYFKAYNDAKGHLAGDDCLRALARALAAQAQRPLDIAVRYGGEEFLLVWFDLDPAEVLVDIAERARQRVAALGLPHEASPVGDFVSVSCGAAATVPTAGQDPMAFLERADAALYEAKRRGRNQTVAVPHFVAPEEVMYSQPEIVET
ncbi:diguanylate cyclase [Salinisphaera sp. PC39]|uniref:GGDEF domain-containing protein n=1 Tax=Salinisphaera sp. PC39 TaxID=1304156 RepID=UPI0033421CD8